MVECNCTVARGISPIRRDAQRFGWIAASLALLAMTKAWTEMCELVRHCLRNTPNAVIASPSGRGNPVGIVAWDAGTIRWVALRFRWIAASG
jgi:hypothetical protein